MVVKYIIQKNNIFLSLIPIFAKNQKNYLSSVSQEHGVLKVEEEVFENINIGNIIGIIPVHSCLTVNLMKNLMTFDNEVIETMR